MKEIIDLSALPEIDRDIYLNDSWCDDCNEADLGINNPELYIDGGRKYIGGTCKVCGAICTSEIIEKHME
ncbi:hypothetical protein [Marinimicrobium alkaliphilum]|uniref:hypothetical protein n=1 Tax=Marinimicrobium alkaliphilum TaxID=2202654 RepID=UPI000DBA2FE3|nr:hypothetical protein [Marinimicrobium alkaliphilum]